MFVFFLRCFPRYSITYKLTLLPENTAINKMATVPSFPNLLVFKTKYFIKFKKAKFEIDNLHGSTYKTYLCCSV